MTEPSDYPVPLDDRIIVRPIQNPTMTKGGIALPECAVEKPQRGVIMAVGPGKLLENGARSTMQVRVGQTIQYARYSGVEVAIFGEPHVTMKESESYFIEKS